MPLEELCASAILFSDLTVHQHKHYNKPNFPSNEADSSRTSFACASICLDWRRPDGAGRQVSGAPKYCSTDSLVGGSAMRAGLRQGDPISPMLFVLTMEVLNHALRWVEEHGLLSHLRGFVGGRVSLLR